jgi:tRNA G10  N-methylase Trm11
MNQYYEALQRGEDIRANLIELKKICKDSTQAKTLLAEGIDAGWLAQFLRHEDAKCRKNAAQLLGELAVQSTAQSIFDAYEAENTRFVRSAYLSALKAMDVTPFLDTLKARYESLLAYEPLEEEKKHVKEERALLQQLLAKEHVLEGHRFCGWKLKNDIIFTTEPALREHLEKQLQSFGRQEIKTKIHPMGVRVLTRDLAALARLHSYRELLHVVHVKEQPGGTADDMARILLDGDLLALIEQNHRGEAPYYFRVELRGVSEERSELAKQLAKSIEERSGGRLLNSTTDYEVELRLTRTRNGFYPCLKFYTIDDERFAWRKHITANSMHPALAAALIGLAKPFLTKDAVVLDALCGVGTFVIERNLLGQTYDNYAVDIFGEAIAGARENAALAGVDCNFVMKDFTQFSSKHLMTEIFADMPKRGKRSKEEMDAFYQGCFGRFQKLLKPGGYLFLYSDEEGFVKKNLRLHEKLSLVQEIPIRPKEGSVFYIIKKR